MTKTRISDRTSKFAIWYLAKQQARAGCLVACRQTGWLSGLGNSQKYE